MHLLTLGTMFFKNSKLHPRKMDDEKLNSIKADQFEHLPENEASTLRKQIETPIVSTATWRALFRYASLQDLMIIAVSSVCAVAAGAAVPLNTLILGSLAGVFQDFMNGLPRADFDDEVARRTLFFVYLAVGECQCCCDSYPHCEGKHELVLSLLQSLRSILQPSVSSSLEKASLAKSKSAISRLC